MAKSRLCAGDVVVSRVGANRGMAAVVPAELEGVNCANIVIVRSGDTLSPAYLAELINGRFGEVTLLGSTVGAAQGVINVGTFTRWVLPTPPLTLQNRFASIVEAIERQKARMKADLAELDTLFASLQSRAFNGELMA